MGGGGLVDGNPGGGILPRELVAGAGVHLPVHVGGSLLRFQPEVLWADAIPAPVACFSPLGQMASLRPRRRLRLPRLRSKRKRRRLSAAACCLLPGKCVFRFRTSPGGDFFSVFGLGLFLIPERHSGMSSSLVKF